jgi:hypothetical protein
VRRGGILATVAAEDSGSADTAAAVMRRHGAIDIDQRAAEWKKQGWQGRFEAAEPKARRKAATRARGSYKGPERRVSTAPWLGEERRRAA